MTKSKKTKPPPAVRQPKAALARVDEQALITDLRSLIHAARQRIAVVANSTTTLLYWHPGRRLLTENLQDGRAEYGKQILATVSRELTAEFGQAFGLRALYRAIQFYQCFPVQEIVSTLSTQLSWSHFMELLPVKEPLARDFYAELCRIDHWDVRTLRKKIGGMLFQRTALAKKPQQVIAAEIGQLRAGQLSPDVVFRDPYFLDLLGLTGAYSETDLESAILREIEGALLELGQRLALSRDQEKIRRLATEGQVVEKAADLIKNPLVLEFLGLAERPHYSEADLESAIIDHLESFLLELGKGFLFEAASASSSNAMPPRCCSSPTKWPHARTDILKEWKSPYELNTEATRHLPRSIEAKGFGYTNRRLPPHQSEHLRKSLNAESLRLRARRRNVPQTARILAKAI